MFGLLKKRSHLIGVDLGNDCLKLAQLTNGTEEALLLAGQYVNRPAEIVAGTARWQRWAVDVMREATANGHFKGKEVVAALPANEVYVDHLRWPKKFDGKIEDAIFAKIKQKLPFEPIQKNTMIKYIPTEQDNVMVLATERAVIDRHLAIYERAGLALSSIGVWPVALATCYAHFFGRRKTDLDAIVMLLDIQPDCTNMVISRHKNPLYACSVPIGAKLLKEEPMVGRLVGADRWPTAVSCDLQECADRASDLPVGAGGGTGHLSHRGPAVGGPGADGRLHGGHDCERPRSIRLGPQKRQGQLGPGVRSEPVLNGV